MKAFWLLALLAFHVAAQPLEKRISGVNGWYVPQWDGSLEWMSLEDGEALLAKLEAEENQNRLLVPVNYYLYTLANPTKAQEVEPNTNSIAASNFNPANPTIFVIHGWTQSYKADMNTDIRDAWFLHGDCNVFVVDWARARSIDYASSVIAVSATGEKVGGMVNFLRQQFNLSLDSLHVIGHSLGAHVAGFTGKNVVNGQIHTIVGLDPALPLFSYAKPEKRLASTDAFYVESIQTNGDNLGFLDPIGRGAFYPNGGEKQPGCSLDLTGACSHGRSCEYYAEAIALNDFPTVACATFMDAVNNACGSTYSSVRMSVASNAYAVEGSFYVPVNSAPSYGMGN